jgi:hypothetical protein
VRWAQLGCFTPLMQAHGRMVQEPWTYDERTLDIYRSYVLLHEQLVPYIRAAAATGAYPAQHVAAGLGDAPEHERPLQATLWGELSLGSTAVSARRRHEDRVAPRALVGRPPARRDNVLRALTGYSGVASSTSVPNGSRTYATRWPCGLSAGSASDVQPACSACA